MLKAKAKEAGRRITVGEDKAYDTADHVANLRAINVMPHVDAERQHYRNRQAPPERHRRTHHAARRLWHVAIAPGDDRMHLRLGQAARHDAQDQASRHSQCRCRFHAQSDRLQSDPHSQTADSVVRGRSQCEKMLPQANMPPPPNPETRKKDGKCAPLQILQQTASGGHRKEAKPERTHGPEAHWTLTTSHCKLRNYSAWGRVRQLNVRTVVFSAIQGTDGTASLDPRTSQSQASGPGSRSGTVRTCAAHRRTPCQRSYDRATLAPPETVTSRTAACGARPPSTSDGTAAAGASQF